MQCTCAILSSAASPALHCFSTLSHKWNDFQGREVIAHKMGMCVFFLQCLSEALLILRRNERDVI